MKYIIAHDLGTSGNKATLFSEEGQLMGSTVYAYDCHYFNDNWAEQNPEDWWKAVCDTTRGLIAKTGIDKKDVAAVSFSGQMMGCLCVDKDGNPLRPSIIWADQRSIAQQNAIAERISLSDYYHIAGHRNAASYGLQKLMWVRDNEPEIYKNTYKTLNAKDYIVFKLTGTICTEPSDACGYGCLDLKSLSWSEKILDIAGIDAGKFPEIKPSTYVAGGVTAEAAELCGLAEGTPVVLGGGDGLTANVGAGSVRPGQTYACMGSSAWIASTSDKPVFDDQMRTVTWAHIVPGMYSPNGTMQAAGLSYSWLKNQMAKFESAEAEKLGKSAYDLINAAIEKSPVGANGIIFLPYMLGERAPRWNPAAKGAFIGLKMENERQDVFRSVLEGVTMNLEIILSILRKHLTIEEILVIGGGAKGAVWRQMMADIYDARIKVPSMLEEANSMGAAVTGGVGVGLFKSFDEIDRFLKITDVHEPNPANVKAYEPIKALFEDCYQAMMPVYDKMAGR